MFYKPKHAKVDPNSFTERTKRLVNQIIDWYIGMPSRYQSISVIAIDKLDEVVDRFGGESTSEEIG